MTLSQRVSYGTGVVFMIFGIVLGFSWPYIYQSVSKKNLELSPSSETFKLWVKTPIPMYLDIYLFNWTNQDEFLKNKKVKPTFEEVGPFVFKEVHERVNISWDENTVSYNQTRMWTFVPEESVDLSSPIFNLNVIPVVITKMSSQYSHIVQWLLNFLNNIYKEKLIIARPAREWLFDGISDKLLNLIQALHVNIPYDKFGWFYERNLSSSFDGRFDIKTGTQNIFNLGALKKWNNVNQTNFYDGECGVVQGSSGELFAPLKSMQDNLTIFITDFCGTLTLNYLGLKSVEGLDGYHYVGDKSAFDNGTIYPSSKCYCSGKCSPSGVRNVTSCRKAPLFISFPHFYLADPIYTKSVGGLRPNKSEHEFYISIDPLTGIPLEVRAQLQLNILLEPMPDFVMLKDVPRIYLPMMWFRQRARVTPELASRGKVLELLSKIGLGVACGFAVLGLLVVVITVCVVSYYTKKRRFQPLISPDDAKDDEPYYGSSDTER